MNKIPDFLSLDLTTRKRIIDRFININGLSSPRSKYAKDQDQEMFRQGFKRQGTYRKLLFKQILSEL